MSDKNQEESTDSREELIDEIADIFEDSPILDFVFDIYSGDIKLEDILSGMEFTESELSTLESHILRSSGVLRTGLPTGYEYLPISRLYISILERDNEISTEIQDGIGMLKDDYDYRQLSNKDQERIGKVISETKQYLRPRFIAEKSSDELLLLLTLVSEVLEEQSKTLFKFEIIGKEYEKSHKTTELIDGLSQDQIEMLLLRSGTITEDIYSELQHVRHTRNTLVHSVDERLTLEQTAKASSEAQRAIDALNDIVEINEGIRPTNTQ